MGTLISFSTQPGNVALDGVGRNSPFAGALVQQLTTQRDDLSTILIGVRNLVMAETGNRQVPWEHSALRARFYLHAAPSGDAAAIGLPPQLSEAAQTWAVTKDSKSTAVLRAFIAKYPGTVFEALAAARLKELEEEADGSELCRIHLGRTRRRRRALTHPFDGVWNVALTGGEHCPVKSGGHQITIVNGAVTGFGGTVSASGAISYDKPSAVNPANKIRYTGKLSGDTGSGTYRALNGPVRRHIGNEEILSRATASSQRRRKGVRGLTMARGRSILPPISIAHSRRTAFPSGSRVERLGSAPRAGPSRRARQLRIQYSRQGEPFCLP